MTPFKELTSVAAPVEGADINTDIIFPARFLLLPEKKGLGEQLFHEKRVNAPSNQPFVLDYAPYNTARIMVAGRNFGCGSSREQAVWALADFGIRCVIAPSFGEIFYNNCFKNGVLPLVETGERYAELLAAASAAEPITIDLLGERLVLVSGKVLPVQVDPFRRAALLAGLDEIGSILATDHADIEAFEQSQRHSEPWLYLGPEKLACFADLQDEVVVD
ncbi:3-isopropylmalate dehydratase small subunit [Lichenifustis flavocetrariae]|uniref:3-isopropylmalate dehydratase n=1 Tax=Lichenifustis flavocetrariae TaxID=2949735 RepID=A0AA42CMC7_9HYPH|nr:3-isopropylmalate dehydratase small subunit [Lichenifustis flavocetrariae]MCW6512544.1 3-isopropylmalate dehydratase small subunit [Lichenifustis flavocetrariae]